MEQDNSILRFLENILYYRFQTFTLLCIGERHYKVFEENLSNISQLFTVRYLDYLTNPRRYNSKTFIEPPEPTLRKTQ